MTVKEAREKLFQLHLEYDMKPPKEREKFYPEYIRKLKQVKKELGQAIIEEQNEKKK